jgi:hypothetical protein
MITRSTLISLWIAEFDDGRYSVDLRRSQPEHSYEPILQTMYSDSSLCLEELGSCIDGMLFHWLTMGPGPRILGATG